MAQEWFNIVPNDIEIPKAEAWGEVRWDRERGFIREYNEAEQVRIGRHRAADWE